MTRIRFRTKVLFITVIPVILTALILASIFISDRINGLNKATYEKGRNIASYISLMSEYGVFSNNFSYLDSTLSHTINQQDIVAIYIENTNNSIVHKKLKANNLDFEIKNIDESLYRVFSSNITKTSIELDDLSSDVNSNANTDEIIGSVNIVMELYNTNILKTEIIHSGISITVILIFATIFIALLFSRSVTKPITKINRAVNIIKHGGLQHRVPVDFSGELAELAYGINDMTTSLEEAQIKEKQRAEDILFIEKSKAQITLDAIGDGVITTDTHGNVTYLNYAAEVLTGFTLTDSINKPLSYVFNVKKENRDIFSDYPIMDCIHHSYKIHHDSGYVLKNKSGTEYSIRETSTPLLDKEGAVVGAVLVFHDFTKMKKMSDVLTYQATHDELTGLMNRRAFEDKMRNILNNISPDETHTLCYFDLDRFKIINDTCGHIAGDNLLKILSESISKHVRRNDLFARLGGDEFGVVFLNCDTEKAAVLAENIRKIVSDIKFSWGSHDFEVGASIGIVPITHLQNLTQLMMTVDTACYVAKSKGRNRIHFYEKNDEDILQREGELKWFQAINKALDENSFVLYSQKISPHSSSAKNDIHEILIRLKKDAEIIMPGAFIPAAERYNLMPKVDMWVISTLFKELNTHKELKADACFSINLSGQTLTDPSFINFLHKEFDASEISPEKIVFEITETAAITNFNEAINFIQTFKQRGCKFALDDFGSGMSSFQYLSELPLDYIKIDGSFVKNIHDNLYNQSVIKSISQIGHSLGLEIIAEFVENKQILDELDKSLIDFVQGYEIEHPHPLFENKLSQAVQPEQDVS